MGRKNTAFLTQDEQKINLKTRDNYLQNIRIKISLQTQQTHLCLKNYTHTHTHKERNSFKPKKQIKVNSRFKVLFTKRLKIPRKFFPNHLLFSLNNTSKHHFFLLTQMFAKSLQSCPTLCDPIDGSPPGSSVPGILQARTLEWVAISFSNA